MAFESNFATLIGNLTADLDLRFTPAGKPVGQGRVAHNTKKGGEEHTDFIPFVVFGDVAENAAESLHKGDRVLLVGRYQTRSYENKDGQTVWVTELVADEVCPSLRWARASVSKVSGGGSQSNPGPSGDDEDVPF